MTDYSKLSDAELDARIAAAEAKRGKSADYSSLSDQELDARIAALEGPSLPGVVQEMHPAFTTADRLLVKNLSNDDQASVDYLRRQHPDLEVKLGTDNQILARGRGEKDYRVLDPNKGFFSTLMDPMEALRDVGDVGYDIASGIGTSAATAAGGLAGAAAGGVGAIPAAMGAGAAASTGLEGLRQLAGGAFGINKEADLVGLGAAGAAGALSPLLLGTGAAKGAIKSTAEKLGTSAFDVAKSQRGVLGIGVDKAVKPAAAKLGGFMSGTSSDALKTLGSRFDEFSDFTKAGNLRKFLNETGEEIDTAFKTAKDDAYANYDRALGAYADEPIVSVEGVKNGFKREIQQARQRVLAGKGTEASKEFLGKLEEAYQRLFTYDDVVPETQMVRNPANPFEMIPEQVGETAVKKEITKLSPRAALDLERQLSDLANLQAINPKAVTGNRFSGSMTADEKKLQMIAGNLKKQLSQTMETVLPKNAVQAKQKVSSLLDLQAEIDALMTSGRQSFTNLKNSGVASNRYVKELFGEVDKTIGTDLQGRAALSEAADLFGPGRKTFWYNMGKGQIPGALLGGLAGAQIGRQDGASGTGFLVGSGAGYILSNPTMMREYIRAGIKAGNLNQALAPLRVGAGKEILEEQVSPWLNARSP